MLQYIMKRVMFSLLVMFAISIIVFSAVRMLPGDVCKIVLATPDVNQKECDAIRAELGLDQPAVKQYVTYMGNALQGDFGKTLLSKRDVGTEIRERIPLTLELTLLATGLGLLLGTVSK